MKATPNLLLMLSFLYFGTSAVWGQHDCPSHVDYKQFANETLTDCNFDLARVNDTLLHMQGAAQNFKDCACEEFILCLGLQLKLFGQDELSRFQGSCDIQLPDLHFVMGAMQWNSKEYQTALNEFQLAMEGGVDPWLCLTNMAQCATNLQQFDEARNYLIDALAKEANAHPQMLSTYLQLTEINLVQGHYESAIAWTQELDDKITEMETQEFPPVLQSKIVRADDYNSFNKLRCRFGNLDTSYVRSNWTKIPWGSTEVDPHVQLKAIRQTAEMLQSSTVIDHLKVHIQNLFKSNRVENADGLGFFNVLAPDVLDSVFPDAEAFQVWNWAQKSAAVIIPEAQKRPRHQATQSISQPALTPLQSDLGKGLLILLSVILVSTMLRKVYKAQQLTHDSKEHMLNLVRDYISGRTTNKTAALRALHILDDLHENHVDRSTKKYADLLNSTELEILSLVRSKIPPKEIARLKGCSPGHVYNTTSQIRAKLQIDPEVTLSEWLKDN